MRRVLHKLLLGALLLFVATPSNGQVTLEQCQKKARENYPAINRLNLLQLSLNYSLSNISRVYLPQINLSLGATYQSDVTAIPQSLSDLLSNLSGQSVEFPSIDKDQYQAVLEVSQLIWDGGATSAQKGGERALTQIESEKVEVELYALKKRVADIFFAIVALEGQLKEWKLHSQLLRANRDELESLYKEGVVAPFDIDLLEVEEIKAEQVRIGVESDIDNYRKMLSILTGDSNLITEQLEAPNHLLQSQYDIVNRNSTFANYRPELSLLSAQKSYLEWQAKGVKSSLMPSLALFAQGGYGNPGLNMFEPGFTGYYILGAKLKWGISSFYNQRNTLQKIGVNVKEIELQQESFLLDAKLQTTQALGEISKIQKQLQSDKRIVEIEQRVMEAAISKMVNGTISLSEFIKAINDYKSASMRREMREVELMMALYKASYLSNN